IWTGSFLAATSLGSRLTLVTVLLVPLILSRKFFSISLKLILLICIFCSLIATLILANRSLFVILSVTFIMGLIYHLKLHSNNVMKFLRVIVVIIAFIIFSVLIYKFDVFGVQTFYDTSSFSNRLEKT